MKGMKDVEYTQINSGKDAKTARCEVKKSKNISHRDGPLNRATKGEFEGINQACKEKTEQINIEECEGREERSIQILGRFAEDQKN